MLRPKRWHRSPASGVAAFAARRWGVYPRIRGGWAEDGRWLRPPARADLGGEGAGALAWRPPGGSPGARQHRGRRAGARVRLPAEAPWVPPSPQRSADTCRRVARARSSARGRGATCPVGPGVLRWGAACVVGASACAVRGRAFLVMPRSYVNSSGHEFTTSVCNAEVCPEAVQCLARCGQTILHAPISGCSWNDHIDHPSVRPGAGADP